VDHDHARYLATLEDDSTALLVAARAAGPEATVPGRPEQTTTALLWHVGRLHDFWAWVLRTHATGADEYAEPQPPGADLGAGERFDTAVTFAGERAAELHRLLTDADPATPVWTPASARDAGWVLRRVVHETALCRVDAERAAGRDYRLAPELAAAAIDDLLEHVPEIAAAVGGQPLAGSAHVHCTDADGEWTVRAGDEGLTVARDHAKADAALRGAAHDLALVLSGRQPLDAVTVFGDEALAATFVALTSAG
jgi:uncharacterized protein (TIGR03083 family)